MKHWYKLWQTQDLIVQKPCDGQWVLLCVTWHLAEGIQEMVPGLRGDRCLPALQEGWGWRWAPHLPCALPPGDTPRQDAPTDRTGPPVQTLAGIIIIQPEAQRTSGISCTVMPERALFYTTPWRAEPFVSGRWCGAELFFWALTCLMHPDKWRMLVWKFAATLR